MTFDEQFFKTLYLGN